MSFFKSVFWKSNSKHQKLSEELALQNTTDSTENFNVTADYDVVTFKIKYLGSTVIEKILGDNVAQEAVKRILKQMKTEKKKPLRVNFSISLKGLVVTDLKGNDVLKISIYRISNCCTDLSQPQIFSFTSTDAHETTECHAFSCGKRKFAETVALTVAHAFTTAYEEWRILPSAKEFQVAMETKEIGVPEIKEEKKNRLFLQGKTEEEQLIEFEDEESSRGHEIDFFNESELQLQRPWVSFDDETVLKPQPVM